MNIEIDDKETMKRISLSADESNSYFFIPRMKMLINIRKINVAIIAL